MTRHQRFAVHLVTELDAEFGQRGHGFGNFCELGQATQIAHGKMAQHPRAQAPQGAGQGDFVAGGFADEGLHGVGVDRSSNGRFKLFAQPRSAVQHALEIARQTCGEIDLGFVHRGDPALCDGQRP